MKKAVIPLSISILLLGLASAICIPGICGCVSWIGIPGSSISGRVAIPFYATGIAGMVTSISWLAFAAIRSAVRRIRNP